MVTIYKDNLYSEISGDFPHALIKPIVTYKIKGYQFTRAFQRGGGKWDGSINLLKFNYKTGRYIVPSGLTFDIENLLKRNGYDVKVIDKRIPPPLILNAPISKNFLDGIELRDYQIKTIETAIERTCGVIHLATNAGKTEVAA